jgi:hypothetical protein
MGMKQVRFGQAADILKIDANDPNGTSERYADD